MNECGFDPYEDARIAFDVRFYLVAIFFFFFGRFEIFPFRVRCFYFLFYLVLF